MTQERVVQFAARVKTSIAMSVAIYARGLTDTPGKKTCAEMARHQGVDPRRLSRALSTEQATIKHISSTQLKKLKRRMKKYPHGAFVLDDGSIMKIYANDIEGTSIIRDGSTGMLAGGLSTVVIGWCDTEGFLPLDHVFWHAAELMGKAYKTKQRLAQELILRYIEYIQKYGIVLDGLYAIQEMVIFFNDHRISFVMKMHSNRTIEHGGVKEQLQHHPSLKLERNSRDKTIEATWKDFSLFVTVEKMKNRDGSIAYRYLMSNKKMTTQEYIYRYWLRWSIEKFFRTAKQKLGFSQCQSTAIEKQNAHIFIVFHAYTKLQEKSVEFRFDSVDEFIRYLRLAKFKQHTHPITASDQIFTAYA